MAGYTSVRSRYSLRRARSAQARPILFCGPRSMPGGACEWWSSHASWPSSAKTQTRVQRVSQARTLPARALPKLRAQQESHSGPPRPRAGNGSDRPRGPCPHTPSTIQGVAPSTSTIAASLPVNTTVENPTSADRAAGDHRTPIAVPPTAMIAAAMAVVSGATSLRHCLSRCPRS